jgi:1,2-diacylglycerol 3-beta-glucosyltransferase
MSNFADTLPPEFDPEFFAGYSGRRLKAAFALSALWSGTAILHWMSWGHWIVLSLTALVAVHLFRLMFAKGEPLPEPLPSWQETSASATAPLSEQQWPYISLLISAKNEEAVIASLVESLCQLDYPKERYDIWVINDNSCDRTGDILNQLAQTQPQLNVVHRGVDATGGKSGALNSVWPKTKAQIFAVFDADAKVQSDLLRRAVPVFQSEAIGALQVRKVIVNAPKNFWTRGQEAEMALDSYYQEQRLAVGGIGELRGNGQFVRRSAIAQCGGWNEETITDDLDLTLQLHLNDWDIAFMTFPTVGEEGVTRAMALWHQRNRWGEGGYQRYLDYWRKLARNRLGTQKSLDVFVFWVLQYMLPTVTVPDLVFAIARHRMPVFGPLTTLAVTISCWGMFMGLRRTQKSSIFRAAFQTLRGTIYMTHWIVVMSSMTTRIALRPKKLKWVKTVHQGYEAELAS